MLYTNEKSILLNEHGLRAWKHKTNKNWFAYAPYSWCDYLSTLDESKGRLVTSNGQYSTFDFTDWIPVTIEEYSKVKRNFKEIYE